MVKFNSAYMNPQMEDKRLNMPYFDIIELSRSFYKKPKNSVIVLLAVVLFVEFIAWVVIPHVKINTYQHYNTFFHYLKNFILGFIAPELCTLAILMYMINILHRKLRFDTLELKPLDILRYELSFLPLFLVAFFIFFPITLNIRYLLREFPDYTFDRYSLYIFHAFTWDTYFLYLPFVLILGYGLINLSLIKDFMDASKRIVAPMSINTVPSVVKNDIQFVKNNTQRAINTETSIALLPDDYYKQSITVKDHKGDVVLNVDECCYFETAGKHLNVYHTGGIYRRTQSLTCLEAELDPKVFVRINRQYILNLGFVKSFTYWEKGKYIIHLNTPDSGSIIMPRAQLQSFKEALENFVLMDS